MERAYNELHSLGHAHSLEVWQEKELAGGIYGLMIGSVICWTARSEIRTSY
jgi:leucyl/phenylalanyl-tRNA--protein transferase